MSRLAWSAVALTFAAPPAAATMMYAKPGVSIAALQADAEVCMKAARQAPLGRVDQSGPFVMGYAAGGITGAATASFLSGFAEGLRRTRELQSREAACMRRNGYAQLTLTAEEEVEFSKAKAGGQASKEAWGRAYMSRDIRAIVEAALKPAVRPLPTVEVRAFSIGGVTFDPASLAAARGPVGKRGELLAGKAVHRATAKVVAPLHEKVGVARVAIEQGATFFALDYRSETALDPEMSSIWCGPMIGKSNVLQKLPPVSCLQSEFDGYRVLGQGAYAGPYGPGMTWLVGPLVEGQGTVLLSTSRLELQRSDQDLIGPMDVRLTVAIIDRKNVTLVASAQRDGRSVDFWRGSLPWDAEGRAVLPFWTHKLTLTHKGDVVEADYTPDGDGRGWIDPPRAKVVKPAS